MSTFLDLYRGDAFAQTKAIASALATSDMIPTHFRDKPANVLLALEFAYRNDIAPFAAMQSMFVVSGKVGMSAAMAISLARKHGVWKSLRYETTGQGDGLAVRAIAKVEDATEVSAKVTMQQAISAGWTRNPIYKSLPELMLQYRAATFLIRTHFPEVLLGMQTTEELHDVQAAQSNAPMINVTPVAVIAEQPQAEEKLPLKRPAAVKPVTPRPPVTAQPTSNVAPEPEQKYLKMLLEKFRARTNDPDVLDLMRTIDENQTKAGAANILHQVLLDAVEGRGIKGLQEWVNRAVLIHSETAPPIVGETIKDEEIPF